VKVSHLAKLKRSFASQVYGVRNVNEASRSLTVPYTISNGFDLHTPIHLQLSQPQPQNNEAPQKAIELGYILNLMT
jgi:MADS-box transcription factor